MHNGTHGSDNATPEIVELGYDPRDVHIPALVWNISVIWALIVVTMVLMVWMLGYLKAQKAKTDAALGEANPLMVQEGRHIPAAPLLQQNEQSDLQSMKDNEDRILNSAGWVERKENNQGVVRLPIGRAMDIVAEKAANTKMLPYWPLPASQSNPTAVQSLTPVQPAKAAE
ncbi:MAG: hypothetical protein HZB26_05620 [Candidatus Hydrogenedentes bacterium]|nr:hypothetical protein [Candidatus Hydrogenedentota bacterium]